MQFSIVNCGIGEGNIVTNVGTTSLEAGTSAGGNGAFTWNDSTVAQFFANTG
jgi:hypothetical protein